MGTVSVNPQLNTPGDKPFVLTLCLVFASNGVDRSGNFQVQFSVYNSINLGYWKDWNGQDLF